VTRLRSAVHLDWSPNRKGWERQERTGRKGILRSSRRGNLPERLTGVERMAGGLVRGVVWGDLAGREGVTNNPTYWTDWCDRR
jgi:hypothetical protein